MAPKPSPTTNLAAAKSGDRRAALERLRDTLAATLDECDPNVRPQVAAQYRATLADLAALPAAQKSQLDELQARRAERRQAGRQPGQRTGTK